MKRISGFVLFILCTFSCWVYAESLDIYSFLYSWFSDAVIDWGIELGVPLTFITYVRS